MTGPNFLKQSRIEQGTNRLLYACFSEVPAAAAGITLLALYSNFETK